MPTGKVKFFDEEKGFGFIASDEGQEGMAAFLSKRSPAWAPPAADEGDKS